MATFSWEKTAPSPVGVFVVTSSSIKPFSKDIPKKLRDQLHAHESDYSDQWIDRFHKRVEEWRERGRQRRKKKLAS